MYHYPDRYCWNNNLSALTLMNPFGVGFIDFHTLRMNFTSYWLMNMYVCPFLSIRKVKILARLKFRISFRRKIIFFSFFFYYSTNHPYFVLEIWKATSLFKISKIFFSSFFSFFHLTFWIFIEQGFLGFWVCWIHVSGYEYE